MEKDKSLMNNSMQYGLIFGVVLVIYSVVNTLTGMNEKMLAGGMALSAVSLFLSLIIYFAGIFISQKSYRVNKLDNVITYGQALSFGILVTVFGSFLVAVYNFIYAQWINPEFGQQIYELSRQVTIDMLDRFNVPDSAYDEALAKLEENGVQSPSDFAFGAIMNGLVMGTIVSLITSIFVKKKGSDPFAEINDVN